MPNRGDPWFPFFFSLLLLVKQAVSALFAGRLSRLYYQIFQLIFPAVPGVVAAHLE